MNKKQIVRELSQLTKVYFRIYGDSTLISDLVDKYDIWAEDDLGSISHWNSHPVYNLTAFKGELEKLILTALITYNILHPDHYFID